MAEVMAGSPDRFKYVITPNVLHMVRLMENPDSMRPLFERAWCVVCDSRVLSGMARLSGLRLPVTTGSDLTAKLVALAAKRRLTVAVVGSTAEDCAILERRNPGLRILQYTPPMKFIGSEAEIAKCIDFVVACKTDLVFLAVGMPQQEILASRMADHPQARGIGLCIGASIDFLTGKQTRAPVYFQKTGLEWLYRLASNPRRLAYRYLVECPRIFYLVFLKHGYR